MGRERRTAERYKVECSARVQARGGGASNDCRLMDVSDAGVRLHAGGIEIPDEFELLLPPENQNRACQVVWRLGFEIGAKFVDHNYAFDWSVLAADAA